MYRFVTIALSLCLFLGLSTFAQDEKKEAPADQPKAETPAPPADAPKAEAPAAPAQPEPAPAAATPAPPAEKPIPPEVQAKLEAARKAVAEAVAAAEAAGLVESSIDPPPILDILITGRATDGATLKAKADELKAKADASPEAGVSPEVFGAWFTGFGKAVEGITAEKNVRIIPPSKGLQTWYEERARVFNPYLTEARKAAAPAPAETPKEEAKPAEAPKEEMKKEEAKPAEEPKKEEAKPAEEPKEEAKPAEEPKEEAPKEEAKPAEEAPKEEAKPVEEAPKEEPKPAEEPKEEAPKEEPKA